MGLGPVSQKSRELCGPEKPFVKVRPAYSVKLVFSYVVKRIKTKITAKFRAPRHLRFEDTKRIMSPEIRPKSCNFFRLFSFHNIWKNQLCGIGGSEFYEWLFGPENGFSGPKSFRDFRETGHRAELFEAGLYSANPRLSGIKINRLHSRCGTDRGSNNSTPVCHVLPFLSW